MLKGHVFKKQIFGNQIFALFVDTFLNKNCGVAGNYKNGMQVTCSGTMLTVNSGAVCIRGRFLEEDTSTDVPAGTEMAFCKLVIEVDLNKENTEESLNQATYKIVKSVGGYPTLTQTDIVKNNEGVYQYELAQFKTSLSGITDFIDKRTYLNLSSIYNSIQDEYRKVLKQLEDELGSVTDGSDYLLKSAGGIVKGKTIFEGGMEGNVKGNVEGNCSGTANNSNNLRR